MSNSLRSNNESLSAVSEDQASHITRRTSMTRNQTLVNLLQFIRSPVAGKNREPHGPQTREPISSKLEVEENKLLPRGVSTMIFCHMILT